MLYYNFMKSHSLQFYFDVNTQKQPTFNDTTE